MFLCIAYRLSGRGKVHFHNLEETVSVVSSDPPFKDGISDSQGFP